MTTVRSDQAPTQALNFTIPGHRGRLQRRHRRHRGWSRDLRSFHAALWTSAGFAALALLTALLIQPTPKTPDAPEK